MFYYHVSTIVLFMAVVTRWVKAYPADRLIVVSDAVAADELRKSLLISVAPSGMIASVVSVEK